MAKTIKPVKKKVIKTEKRSLSPKKLKINKKGDDASQEQDQAILTVSSKKENKSNQKGHASHIVGADGKSAGSIMLPKELFYAHINPILMAQAVRVYLANQRVGSASTKTRGEVEGSTRKIYRQKGTGRARHGAIRAPIFVGGGIVFGPKPHSYKLKFSSSMRRAALASALTYQHSQGNVIISSELNDLKPKTKIIGTALTKIGATAKTLLVYAKESKNIPQSVRNLKDVESISAQNLNTYAILSHQTLIVTKSALPQLVDTFVRQNTTHALHI